MTIKMKEKTLRVYSHDINGYNPKFRDLTLAQIKRDYYYIMLLNYEDYQGMVINDYVADEALSDYIQNCDSNTFYGNISSYDVNKELEELDWR